MDSIWPWIYIDMLERAHISGYRSCVDTEIPLGQSVVALVGRNGVGKSNILKGLNWIAHTVTSSYSFRPWQLPANSIEAELQLLIDNYRYKYQLSIKRDKRSTVSINERLDVGDSTIFTRNPTELVVHSSDDKLRIRSNAYSIPYLQAFINDTDTLDHVGRVDEFLQQTHYYDLSDAWLGSSYVQEAEYEDWKGSYISTGNPDSSVLHRLVYMFYEDKKLFDEVVDVLGPNGLNLLDFIDVMQLSQSIPESHMESGAGADLVYAVYFGPSSQQAGHGGHFLISDLSSGTRRILKIITYLLFDKRTLLLLEQPEDSVHFGLLRSLIGYLRTYSYNSQVVFTTHSCEALNSLSPEEVRLVHSGNGMTTVRRLTPDQLGVAKSFLQEDGPLSDFIETVYD